MGWLDSFKNGLDFIDDNSNAISTVGNLALGGYSLYQSNQAAETASNFYDAAGETAQQRWDMIEPLEQARVDRELKNLELTDDFGFRESVNQRKQLDLNRMLLNYQAELLPGQMDLATELLKYQQENLPKEQDLYSKNLDVQSKALDTTDKDIDTYEKYRGIDDEYYQQSMEGIDADQESNRAQADVASAFAGTMDAATRELARRGVGPDAAGYQGRINENAIQQAKAIGTARTGARKYAEDVNYNRLGSAMNARQRLAPASTGAITSPSAPVLPSTQTVNTPNYGTPSGGDPTNTYLALGNVAASGASSSSNSGWDLIQRGLNG